jgi:hypothetical protein
MNLDNREGSKDLSLAQKAKNVETELVVYETRSSKLFSVSELSGCP